MSGCPVCGSEYLYGGGDRHVRCRKIAAQRAAVDEAVAWLMSDTPDRGPEPLLITLLRDQILKGRVV